VTLHRRNPERDREEKLILSYLLSGRGVPDLLVAWCGRWLLAEIKGPKGELTGDQQEFFEKALLYGTPTYVLRTVQDASEMLDGHLRRSR
jgi:hypothetical protein